MDGFLTLKPKSDKLTRYIAYYYFHGSVDPGFQTSFLFYPNYKNAITAYKGSKVELTENGSAISPSGGNEVETLYTTNINSGYTVCLKGPFNKIGIVFNPLGLNYFLGKPLSDIVTKRLGRFHYFGYDFEKVAQSVFESAENENKIQLLDAFFETRLSGFQSPNLEIAVDQIIATNGMIKVEALAEMTSTNRKTLLRLFRKHLLCSVEEFKKLVKFRHAVNFSQRESNSLTEVALSGQYYDQADFINQFKSIAKESPSKVIPAISKLGNEEIYWKFFGE